MNKKYSIHYLETRRLKTKGTALVLLAIYALMLILAQVGFERYKKEKADIKIATEHENLKASQFDRYTPYSVYGINLISMPTPLNFLFTLNVYGNLSAAVDVGTKLKIYENKKGINLLLDIMIGYLCFSLFLLLFGSPLSAVFGFRAFSGTGYLRYLCRFKSFKRVFFSILFTRMFYLSLYVLLLAAGTAALAFINGIDIVNGYYLVFTLLVLLLMNFFLCVGAAAGAVRRRSAGKALLAAAPAFFILLAPLILVITITGISGTVSSHQAEYDKLKIMMAFEKKGAKEFGDLRSGAEVNEFMKSYLEDELAILGVIERRHRRELKDKIGAFRFLSFFFPTTFYFSSVIEISGRGFDNYFSFYQFVERHKEGFIRHYFEKEYFSASQPRTQRDVESYVKGDNHILYARGSLPPNFLYGLIIMLAYLAAAAAAAYMLTLRKVYDPRPLPGEEKLFIDLDKVKKTFLFTGLELLKSRIYNHFSGKEKTRGEISLDRGDTIDTSGNIDFAYLVDTGELHGIDAVTLHRFLFGEAPDEHPDLWRVILRHALQRELVVLDEFLRGLPPAAVEDIMIRLEQTNIYWIVISSDYFMLKSLSGRKEDIYTLDGDPTAVGEF